jgi:hypothetical protein
MIHPQKRARRFTFGFLALGLAALVASAPVDAQQPGKNGKNKAGAKGKNAPAQRATQVAPPAPRSALLTQKIWENISRLRLRPGEIDELIAKELQSDKIEAAPLTSDEQYIRRVTLDLTGQLPVPADVNEFAAKTDADKRAKLIDRLLASDEYAAHWSKYWRDVIAARVTDRRGLLLARPFELWLTDQFKRNQGWDKIVRAMICAEGPCRFDDEGKNGAAFFLACHFGPDSAVEQASETSRLFLGIQIQCAQCHDHPSDQWKRVQFHQLVGYFARLQDRPIRAPMGGPAGIELVSLPRGEHEMPSKENPSKLLLTPPRFLDGSSPGNNLADTARRKALADAIVSKKNCWFGAAYVNRLWGELMGQTFYQPIDDMGPEKPAVFGSVLTRLCGAFQGSDYDVKGMFRAIMTSATYQRQIRLGESAEQHLHFAASYPTRLRADALWESLNGVLGTIGIPLPAQQRRPGLMGARTGMEALFKQEFSFDPSLKADEVDGSISQALLMMNNPVINQRIQAKGTNLLARILSAYPEDREAIKMVYLRSLARKPTDREMEKCCQYIDNSESRASAFEDILWALLNSTEFQTKR